MVGPYAIETAGATAAAAENGSPSRTATSRAGCVSRRARVYADDAIAALKPRLAIGPPAALADRLKKMPQCRGRGS